MTLGIEDLQRKDEEIEDLKRERDILLLKIRSLFNRNYKLECEILKLKSQIRK